MSIDHATNVVYSADLAGIVAGETAIADVDGEAGVLSYRGYPVEQLAEKPFLQVTWLLLFGDWPTKEEEAALGAFLVSERSLTENDLLILKSLPRDLHPMQVLQSLVPTIRQHNRQPIKHIADTAREGLAIVARLPTVTAAYHRLNQGLEPVANSDDSSPNREFLRQFHNAEPGEQQVRALDMAQILQLEHSFNCSTYVGRICTSAKAPVSAALAASIGALSGVLHGGADQAALEMARSIGSPEAAAQQVKEILARKEKIMGMGHREYKTVDPRARILKPMAAEACTDPESKNLFDTLCAIEAACQSHFGAKGKEIWANVEFYKGAVFHSLGIPDHYFTALFAMARSYGYLAHYLEFEPVSRLIRPKARYTGPVHQ